LEQLELFPTQEPSEKSAGANALTARATLHRAAVAYHQHMQDQDFSEHTIRAFDSDLRLLSRYLGPRKLIGDIGTDKLQDFVTYLEHERGVPCKPKSLARRLTTLKVFFSWLAEEGAIPKDPAAPLVHRRVKTPLPHVLSEEVIHQLLAATAEWRHDPENPDARPHLLVTLLLDTGIKKGECMNIALQDLDTSRAKSASVLIRYDSIKQRYKERKLRLSSTFCAVLPEYLSQYQPQVKLFECTARNLEYVLDACEKRAGLPRHAVSFENLRWTCALRDLQRGMEHDALRGKLGLSHISWAETFPKLQRLASPAL
jgi:site-specific recombinase XerD